MNRKIVFTIIAVIVVALAAWLLLRNNSDEGTEQSNNESTQSMNQTDTPTQTATATATPTTDAIEGNVVVMEVKDFGTIKIQLDTVNAPQTSANFLKLVNEKFYDGLTFHRILAGFVVQGGDPQGDGTGGPGYTVPAEIKLPHKRGSIATARLGDQVNPTKASSGSQFYFALRDLPELDGEYTVFGQITEGLEVMDKIAAVQVMPGSGMPLEPVVITSVTISK